jgi:hypothetical protein
VLGDGTDTVLSLSLWATRDDLAAASGSAWQRAAAAALAPLLVDASARKLYQVLLDAPAPAAPASG